MQWFNLGTILHMLRQLSCHGMCKIIAWLIIFPVRAIYIFTNFYHKLINLFCKIVLMYLKHNLITYRMINGEYFSNFFCLLYLQMNQNHQNKGYQLNVLIIFDRFRCSSTVGHLLNMKVFIMKCNPDSWIVTVIIINCCWIQDMIINYLRQTEKYVS